MMSSRLRVRAGRVRVCGLRLSVLALSARGFVVRKSGWNTRRISAVRVRASGLSLWVRMDVGSQDLKGGESNRTEGTGVMTPRVGMECQVTVEVDAEGEGHGAGTTTVQLSVRFFLGATRVR